MQNILQKMCKCPFQLPGTVSSVVLQCACSVRFMWCIIFVISVETCIIVWEKGCCSVNCNKRKKMLWVKLSLCSKRSALTGLCLWTLFGHCTLYELEQVVDHWSPKCSPHSSTKHGKWICITIMWWAEHETLVTNTFTWNAVYTPPAIIIIKKRKPLSESSRSANLPQLLTEPFSSHRNTWVCVYITNLWIY